MFQNLLRRLSSELKRKRIPYMIIGGQAVLLYGEPRLTKDVDVTLGIGIDGLGKVITAAKRLKLKILVSDVEEFVSETMVLPTTDERSASRVDFIFSSSAYERMAIGRAVSVRLGRTLVKFASLEDLIIHKIVSGRARDLEDIKSVLLKNPRYDVRYISAWLRKLDAALDEKFLESFWRVLKEVR